MLPPAPTGIHPVPVRAQTYFFSLRRCTRVLRSNLRCFFLDMRLRRFLITEPMLGLLAVVDPLDVLITGPPRNAQQRARTGAQATPHRRIPTKSGATGTRLLIS